MDLLDEAEKFANRSRPKWKILKEDHEDLVYRLLAKQVPIRRQVAFLIEKGIFEKLDEKQYRDILRKHFGYQGRGRYVDLRKRERAKKKREEKREEQQIPRPATKPSSATASDLLSEDVDLLAFQASKL